MRCFTGIVMKSNTIPEGHPLVFSHKALKEIVEYGKFINKPLFACKKLLHHTNRARKHHIGYVSDCWLDKEGNLHVFGTLVKDIPQSTKEPLGLSLDSIIYDLNPIDFALAELEKKQLRVNSLYVQGVTLILHRCAAFKESNFFILG